MTCGDTHRCRVNHTHTSSCFRSLSTPTRTHFSGCVFVNQLEKNADCVFQTLHRRVPVNEVPFGIRSLRCPQICSISMAKCKSLVINPCENCGSKRSHRASGGLRGIFHDLINHENNRFICTEDKCVQPENTSL